MATSPVASDEHCVSQIFPFELADWIYTLWWAFSIESTIGFLETCDTWRHIHASNQVSIWFSPSFQAIWAQLHHADQKFQGFCCSNPWFAPDLWIYIPLSFSCCAMHSSCQTVSLEFDICAFFFIAHGCPWHKQSASFPAKSLHQLSRISNAWWQVADCVMSLNTLCCLSL